MSSRPGLRVARHRGTTANLCTLYPFHTGPGPGRAGPYLGVHVTGGGAAWHYDPFELYPHVLTDSNILIAGRPGRGKSTAVKTFLYRELAVYGRRRFVSISDPKGEYGPLADALGMTIIKLHPGGTARLNVLDAGPGGTEDDLLARQRLLVAMLAAVLGRSLDGPEESLVTRAIEYLARTRLTFDICDLARVAHDPPDELISGHVELHQLTRRELRDAGRAAGFALGKLIDRTLRGMFDGPTNIRVDWEHGPGVVLDLSAVFGDREALPLVMMAATAWLQSAMTALHTQRRGLLVDDEVWAILENEWAVKHLRDRVKLCRARGIANILVCHKLSDLRAQAADGTSAAKVATALLADMQTRIVFQQAPDQIPEAQALLGLSDVEARLLPRLVKGRALWRVADRAAIVQHVVSDEELALTDTDAAMTA